jgi:ubiquinol-cytochrome c reductase iron-sulfur subunit
MRGRLQGEEPVVSEDRKRARGNAIALGFAASSLSSIALAAVYLLGGQVQLEGVLLGVSLGGLAIGLIVWAKELMPEGPYVEEREAIVQPSEQAGAAGALVRGERAIERRSFLGKMLGAAIVCLGAAAVFPIRSLGSRPGRSLEHTEWTRGARLVTLDASPVSPQRLQTGGILTVFPEGAIGSADSQALVIRLGEGEYRPLPGREDWAPANCIAFSKICTHAGCPVGLYQALSHELFCPCHQSVFDVLAGAAPTSGPATRPLPQLPLQIDDEGYLAAAGDFPEPVGPGYWSRGRA